jgi:GNAT superfamily N-acetyltransferase
MEGRRHFDSQRINDPTISTMTPTELFITPPDAEKGTTSVRQLHEDDLATADRIMRLAFGTFMGAVDPASSMGDASYVRTRWKADPAAAFAVELHKEVAGSNFAANWGSVGFVGPLTIRPDLWDKGLAKRLMEPVMHCFDKWQNRHVGLFTFAHSPKHLGLYQKFGFFPRFLTALLAKPVQASGHGSTWTKFSDSSDGADSLLEACRDATDAIFAGLDTTREIQAVADQELGDTVLLWNESKLSGFAVCHCGAGTEAGSGVCYVKFGAVHPGNAAERDFNRLLYACEEFAATQGASRLLLGINTAREKAYRQVLARGFRVDFLGLSMAKPNETGYNRPDVYLIDDWR